jgi:hypothetical protein
VWSFQKLQQLSEILFLFVLFCDAGVGAQNLVHGKQALKSLRATFQPQGFFVTSSLSYLQSAVLVL